MNANTRIQWLHKRLVNNSYPNAQRLSERFHISHRQAQRDLEHLRVKLNAPLAYDNSRRGFYYTEPYTLPVLLTSDNDENYIPEIYNVRSPGELAAEETVIQMQMPYTASLVIRNKLAAMELAPYITERRGKNRFVCEFHSIDRFFGTLLALNADFELVEPEWLRERLVTAARRIIKNNAEEPTEE